ncbi:MAG: FAD-binding protein, partial [Bdellovibrionota bacterium]
MSILYKQFTVPLSEQNLARDMRDLVASDLGLSADDILELEILKKSLDARKKSQIFHHYQLRLVTRDDETLLRTNADKLENFEEKARYHPTNDIDFKGKSFRHPPVIIGSGPAGTFAALVLAELGQKCIVVERGEAVEDRMRTVHR